MSHIEDLIKELAPKGVQFVTLADVAKTVPGLSGKTKTDFSGGNARFVSYKNVFANLAVEQNEPDFVLVGTDEKQNRLHHGDVVFTGSSETGDEVGMSSVVMTEPIEPLYLNSFCFAVRFDDQSMILPGFSKYLFRSEAVRSQVRRTASGVTRINISKQRFVKIRVPVPPLEVQREIVRILDQFTQLEAELEAELEARRRQYGYYRNVLLTESSHHVGYRTLRMSEVAEILVGFPFKSAQFSTHPSDTRLVRGDNVGQGTLKRTEFRRWQRTPSDNLDRYELRADDVVLSMDRPWISSGLKWARIGPADLPALLVQRVACLRGRAGILDQKFLGYVVSSARFTKHVLATQTGNTVPHISGGSIAEFSFQLPPIQEQVRIASVLSEFDALVNDLSIGLPAELFARRKQYEYYRDQLLTFEEVGA